MKVLQANDKRIVVFQGSTGSGKTYTILQFLIIKCLSEWKDKTIDVVRRTTPALKRSVLKDFLDILNKLNIYNPDNHNRSDNSYKLGSNLFRFYSADEEQKMRGLRRDVAYFNEALEFKRMDVMQVMMRTKEQIFMDYNPSDEFHWLYEEILPRNDVTFNVSTYQDNPFLDERVVQEIERLKETDANLWRVYGLGQRGSNKGTIFTNWDYAQASFNDFEGQALYGLDFGFNDPTALVRVKYHRQGIYLEQLLYKTSLTSDLIVKELEKLVTEDKLTRNSIIKADNSRPEIIEELRRARFNVQPVKKGADSILRGINFLKKHKLFLSKESLDLIKEFRNHKWKTDKDEKVLDEPLDFNNHTIDATRYALEGLDKQVTFKIRV